MNGQHFALKMKLKILVTNARHKLQALCKEMFVYYSFIYIKCDECCQMLCVRVEESVCGKDGKTYFNHCKMICAGESEQCKGNRASNEGSQRFHNHGEGSC